MPYNTPYNDSYSKQAMIQQNPDPMSALHIRHQSVTLDAPGLADALNPVSLTSGSPGPPMRNSSQGPQVDSRNSLQGPIAHNH